MRMHTHGSMPWADLLIESQGTNSPRRHILQCWTCWMYSFIHIEAQDTHARRSYFTISCINTHVPIADCEDEVSNDNKSINSLLISIQRWWTDSNQCMLAHLERSIRPHDVVWQLYAYTQRYRKCTLHLSWPQKTETGNRFWRFLPTETTFWRFSRFSNGLPIFAHVWKPGEKACRLGKSTKAVSGFGFLGST